MGIVGPTERPFVDRITERAALAAHIAAAREGRGRVVLVSGDAGVGKTRLVEEAVAGIAADRLLWGRCHDTEGAPAFWPWIQALRAYVRATPRERLRDELGDDAGPLVRLVPAIRAQCPDVAAPSVDDLAPEAARFQLFDAVTMVLRTVAARDALVIVLDDLHWADSESLLLLAFVARELRDLRLLVLGTHRAAGAALEAVHGDALGPLLGDVAHHYLEAAPLGTLPRTIEFATRAGQYAFGRLGYEEAAGHYERALQASRGAAVAPAVRLRILLPLGTAQEAAGDDEGARATLIEAAELARELGDTDAFATAAALAGASGAETGTLDLTLLHLLKDAVELAGPEDTRRRAVLLAQLARSLYFGDAARRHAYSSEAVAVARRLDDRVALLAALRARQLALWEPGEGASRRAIGTEILQLATASREPLAIAEALAWRILDHLEMAAMPVVHESLRRYRELAAACRLPRVRWHVTVVEAALAHLAGRLADAERLAQRAVGLLAPSSRNNVATFFGVQLFLIREEQGRLAELEPVVVTAAERAANLPIWRAGLALLHAAGGRADAALWVLGELGAARFADLPRDGNLLGTYARVAEACALLAAPHLAEPLLPLLAPHVDDVVVLATTAGCLGSAARYAGLVAHALGRFDEAVGHFEKALATNERIGALPQLAHARRELACTMRVRGAPGDRGRAAVLEAEAGATAARLGLVALQGRLAGVGVTPPPAATGSKAATPVRTAQRTACLRREGDVWTVSCGEELTRLKGTKGLAYLVELLRRPGQELHALDLGGVEDVRTGDAGEMLDADARRAYKARLGELREELEEAEGFHDIGRAARLREEMEMLAGELARASGLGGRARKAGSDAERARLNVTRAVRKVVRKIQAECPLLGRHLDRSVQTGLFCAYEPDPTFPVHWDL